jgi:hypothetical protein
MTVIPQPNEIARGRAGDCCVLCGQVGIDLPLDHGCQPNIDVQAHRAERAADADRYDWEAAWTRPNVREIKPPTEWIDHQTGEVLPQPPPKVMAARLAGICRTVAATREGKRQTIGYTWAARILKENNYPAAAWDAVEHAMYEAGASDHDVRTALRERPGRGRVNE